MYLDVRRVSRGAAIERDHQITRQDPALTLRERGQGRTRSVQMYPVEGGAQTDLDNAAPACDEGLGSQVHLHTAG